MGKHVRFRACGPVRGLRGAPWWGCWSSCSGSVCCVAPPGRGGSGRPGFSSPGPPRRRSPGPWPQGHPRPASSSRPTTGRVCPAVARAIGAMTCSGPPRRRGFPPRTSCCPRCMTPAPLPAAPGSPTRPSSPSRPGARRPPLCRPRR
ncbi:hypothetical protein STRAU_5279 [Streptomyces aurantiacus JA 4570]|uniref:Uncharacterized protein n=1 Tax=Streptomyces aurantiacus JA 4570 TaxID=1286094 RepID=S3ZGC3_9ACTN|nr:hypothetical protein STRAU_5279 [Streptomyces aurantiacus JA 4570]